MRVIATITEPPVVQMGIHSLKRWPELIAQLDEPVFFQQAGTLVLWHRQDAPEAERFSRKMDATCAWRPSSKAAMDSISAAVTTP